VSDAAWLCWRGRLSGQAQLMPPMKDECQVCVWCGGGGLVGVRGVMQVVRDGCADGGVLQG
jgi:hypothetical protein